MSDENEEMIPRIVIRDSVDRAMILQALALYSLQCITSVQAGYGDFIAKNERAATLMATILEDGVRIAEEKQLDEVTEEFRETLNNFTDEELVRRILDNDN